MIATLSSMRRRLTDIRTDQRGAALMEFGLVVSVFIMMLMGVFDLGQRMYLLSVVEGAAQDAARLSSLESGNPTTADNNVLSMARLVAPGATINTSRRSYFDFADIDRPERFSDDNLNGTCDQGESYTDENNNGSWQSDIGANNNGGASDVVLYTVTITYKPLFAMPFLPGSGDLRQTSASTVRKNQPFANQSTYGSVQRNCA